MNEFMTVLELIEKLKSLPPDARILVHGRDETYYEAGKVEYWPQENTVLIW